MYRTQLIQRIGEVPDFEQANDAGIIGDLSEHLIDSAVRWELTRAWEEGELDARYDMQFVAVAVWRGEEFIGVYTMDAEERCPEWVNLVKVAP